MLGAWDQNVGAGGHMSSKLAQRVAVNGLCKSYMAFNTNYHDTGLFGVYAVADKHQPVSFCYLLSLMQRAVSIIVCRASMHLALMLCSFAADLITLQLPIDLCIAYICIPLMCIYTLSKCMIVMCSISYECNYDLHVNGRVT